MILEPIVNALQSKSLDLFYCLKHVKVIKAVIGDHRSNADDIIINLLKDAEEIGVELNPPRIVRRQQYRSNHPSEDVSDYWKRALLIPYLDSLICSLEERFSDDNLPAFSLLSLHPSNMLQIYEQIYELTNLEHEIELWYSLWKEKNLDNTQLKDLEMCEIIKETEMFFPCISKAIEISLAQPCTTCTIERSFSTLKRVKTWLRSTMIESRLNGLCVLSVHRQMVNQIKSVARRSIK